MTTPTARQSAGAPHQVLRTRLPGGVRVVTDEMPGASSVNLGIYVGVGSRDEAPHEHGASHFLEHVLFKGTPTRSAAEISASIERTGGELNAFTSHEFTCFYARVLPEQAALALDVLTDLTFASMLLPRDIASERAVILDEIDMHADDPMEMASERSMGMLYRGHPLSRPVIGSRTSIARMPGRLVRDFWRRHYRADRVVVASSGLVSHDDVVEPLRRLDASLGRGVAALRVPPHLPTDGGLALSARDFEQSSVSLVVPGVSRIDSRWSAAQVLTTILGGGMSSRLFLEVRENRGLAYSIDADVHGHSDAGHLEIGWQSAPERVVPILDVVRREIIDLRDRGVRPGEVEDAKASLIGQLRLGMESPASRIGRWGPRELLGDHSSVAATIAALEAVEASDVDTVARTLLAARPVAGVVGANPGRRSLDRALAAW
ncbi:MAG TPA: pitrilysin family protein [Propionibacteriaceae bacterium]|nr:pitrilysin family protein [Propionibacteriaceae bacterium]